MPQIKQTMWAIFVILMIVSGAPAWAADELKPKEAYKLLEDDRQVTFRALEKSEPLAGILSMTAGFGAGEFYAGNSELGVLSLAAQGVALGVVALGGEAASAALYLTLGLRVVDTIAAVFSAESYNEELQQKYARAKLAVLPSHSGASLAWVVSF